MAKAKKRNPGAARRFAWAISSDINFVAIFRLASIASFAALFGIVSWLGSGLISGQTEIGRQMAVGNVNISTAAGRIDDANHRIDMLALRINDMATRLAVVETQVSDGRRHP